MNTPNRFETGVIDFMARKLSAVIAVLYFVSRHQELVFWISLATERASPYYPKKRLQRLVSALMFFGFKIAFRHFTKFIKSCYIVTMV